jgi:hypothetical protein
MSNKFGLVVAINYFKTTNELYGCINDGINIINFLKSKFKYPQENITFLNDKSTELNILPTKINITSNLSTLVQKINSVSGPTELWISYSGHGTRVMDNNNDELSNIYDEVIVPSDYMKAGFVSDDILFDILNGITNKQCKVMALFDCCNSGTILDLKYKYINKNRMRIENKKANIQCPVYMISGCKDFQTSADYFDHETDKYGGALTNTFLRNVNTPANVKFIPLMNNMRIQLKRNGFTQIPQLTTNKDVNDRTYLFKTVNGTLNIFAQDPPPPPPKLTWRQRRRRRRQRLRAQRKARRERFLILLRQRRRRRRRRRR